MTTATQTIPTRTRLSPADAFHTQSTTPTEAANGAAIRSTSTRRGREPRSNRSRSRRRNTTWKKLLWVKQSYPDNYTDEETFLDALQLNPKVRPYEFWPLVIDSTVIVQQVCAMIVFVCCFAGIIQERVSPITIVTWGTIGTVLGWVIWDIWVGQQQANKAVADAKAAAAAAATTTDPQPGNLSRAGSMKEHHNNHGLGLTVPDIGISPAKGHAQRLSSTSLKLVSSPDLAPGDHSRQPSVSGTATPIDGNGLANSPLYDIPPSTSTLSPRNQQRLATAKSAILIYCALLGLSPILKSLTKSTASDSIWAMSFWLMCINVIFFDYGGGVGATFPASLSTNAALMASTVLASRLNSTTDVFSLTLFSIEVFGLFPVFRRYLRHISWRGHLVLTLALVMSASAAVAVIITGGSWMAAVVGVIAGSLLTTFGMGLCSWWLIGLQRFKNEIYGPWDPARPIIRRWD